MLHDLRVQSKIQYIVIRLNNDGLIGLLGMLLHMAVIIGSARKVWQTKSMFSWSSNMSPISVKAAAAFQIFDDVPYCRASIWVPIVWKM